MAFCVSESAEQPRKIRRVDPLLVAALSLAFLFCLQGITWGRVECWNRSQIAMRGLRALRPSDYMKPPFHTYLNHILVVWPITAVMKLAQVPKERMKISNAAKLIGSRLLTIGLYLGTIALSYSFSRNSYGRFSAAVIAFALATSAGLIAYAHFLTVDIPLLFWMLAAFWAAYRLASAPSTRNSWRDFDRRPCDFELHSNPETTRLRRCRNTRIHPEQRRISPLYFESGDVPANRNALCFARDSVPDFDDWSGVADVGTAKMDPCVTPAGSGLQLPV